MVKDIGYNLGANYVLREVLDCESSAQLLEHALENDPKTVYAGSDSDLADLVGNSAELSKNLSKLLSPYENTPNGTMVPLQFSIQFNSRQLATSIYKGEISLVATKESNGSWSISGVLRDTYDFTELEFVKEMIGTYMDQNIIQRIVGAFSNFNILTSDTYNLYLLGSNSKNLGLTLANDLALIGQKFGAVKPYDIYVDFSTTFTVSK